jgi:putative ABC transport system ATP-binding protein
MAPLIDVRNLNKIYNLGEVKVHAVADVTLQIERGSFLAIMGPSGSGKSSFVNLLGCLDRPTSGRYFLDGVPGSRWTATSWPKSVTRRLASSFKPSIFCRE